jgi:hypothetical protein
MVSFPTVMGRAAEFGIGKRSLNGVGRPLTGRSVATVVATTALRSAMRREISAKAGSRPSSRLAYAIEDTGENQPLRLVCVALG